MNWIKMLIKWSILACLSCHFDNLLPMMTMRSRKPDYAAVEKAKLLSDSSTDVSIRFADFMATLKQKRCQFIHDFQPGNHNSSIFGSRPIIIEFDNLSRNSFIEMHTGYSRSIKATMLAGHEIKPDHSKHIVFNAAPIMCHGNIAFIIFEFENSKGNFEYLLIGIMLEGNFYPVTPKVFFAILPELKVENPDKNPTLEKELQSDSTDKQYFDMVRDHAEEEIYKTLHHTDFTLQSVLATEQKNHWYQLGDYVVLHVILYSNNYC